MALLASPNKHTTHKLRNDFDMDLSWSAAAALKNKLIFINKKEFFVDNLTAASLKFNISKDFNTDLTHSQFKGYVTSM